MKIKELLASTPISVTKDKYKLERHLNIDMSDIECESIPLVEIRYYVDECFDGERGLEIVSIWFELEGALRPMMLSMSGGRGLSDRKGKAILDPLSYKRMLNYLDSLRSRGNIETVSPEEDIESLDFTYADRGLRDFYCPEGVHPKHKVGNVVVAAVPNDWYESGPITTRVKITKVFPYNPTKTYQGIQIDRRLDSIRRVIVDDPDHGTMYAYFSDKDVILRSIPEYGDHMTLEEWKDGVASGGFIDYDGYGELATKDGCSDIEIHPSQLNGFLFPSWCTHIVWYNR